MIRYTEGNLLDASVDPREHTVNEVGVMGKGVALMFRERFPASSEQYRRAAKKGEVHVGRVFVTESDSLVGPRWLIHFPTKKHWDIHRGSAGFMTVCATSSACFIGAVSNRWPCRHWVAGTGDWTGTSCAVRSSSRSTRCRT